MESPIIRNIRGSYFGFCDLSISSLWESLPIFFRDVGMVVTCVDSTEKVSSSPTVRSRIAQGWNLFNLGENAIYVPNAEIAKFMEDRGMFYGFDECYLTTQQPTNRSLAEGHFTTDGFNFSQQVSDNFFERFQSLGAIRYLSDGCGLNFVTESEELAKAVLDLAAA